MGLGVRGLASPHPLGATSGRRTVFGFFWFRTVRFAWFDSEYSSCVSLRWLLVATSHIFRVKVGLGS